MNTAVELLGYQAVRTFLREPAAHPGVWPGALERGFPVISHGELSESA